MTTSKISLQSSIALSTVFGSSLRWGKAEFTAPFRAWINSLNCWSKASVLGAGVHLSLALSQYRVTSFESNPKPENSYYVYKRPLFGSGIVRPILVIKASISSLYCWRATALGRRLRPQNM